MAWSLALSPAPALGTSTHQPQEASVPNPMPATSLVGTAYRDFADRERSNWLQTGPRPLRTILWYPRTEETTPETENTTSCPKPRTGDTPPAGSTDKRPLVLISHGSGSRARDMDWLGHALAARGIIAAAVEHNGSEEEELRSKPTPSDHFSWERARDLSVVLDRLLDDPEFGRIIDCERIGAAGFSLGGTTVLRVAGARLDLAYLQRNAPAVPAFLAPAIKRLLQLPQVNDAARLSQQRAEQSYRDQRIRGVFALAPAMGFGFTKEGLSDIGVPVEIVVGDIDPVAPPAGNARHFARNVRGARYIELPGERGHFSPATPERERAAELEEVATVAGTFFEGIFRD